MSDAIHLDRRAFLLTGLAGTLAPAQVRKGGAISLVLDPADPVISAAPVQWAAGELQQALTEAGFTVRRRARLAEVAAGEFRIVASVAHGARESLALAPAGNQTLRAEGADARGLVYALLELADRARQAPGRIASPIVERPANPVRSVMRQFTCERLDKPWFYDREMWPRYLTMLATERFNRLHLAFGLGYDSLQQVADSYFLFLYPFLLSVPGYAVRATNLPAAARDRNMEALRFISEQTVARGMEFELGVWMHGYQLLNSPRAQNIIEGLTAETHAPYCRDALTAVLRACPAISSVALRIHGESGVAEGSYDFWATVFDGVKRCGRKVEIDLHSKGTDATMIGNAVATGLPVNVSGKCWAEHLGMPYHQAAMRELEMPVEGHTGRGLMTLSEGARSFTRYGYADLLRDDRKYTVRHRVFSGTQRLLLSGDPLWAASYSRAFQFCGSTGADLMEPLTCRGRRGTGGQGSRSGYADARFETRWDWEKYAVWYRVWGRALYTAEDGAGAVPGGEWLAIASRILPLVTMAHLPSAACDAYWPEVYANQPMVEELGNPYSDTPSPKTFQNVSPLDPQLFSRMSEFADELLKGERSGKYSPIEVAQWLQDLANRAAEGLGPAGQLGTPEAQRLNIDVTMQMGLGRFFAAKFRSGVLYAIHERTGDLRALDEALKAYRAARTFWEDEVAAPAKGVYAADLSTGEHASVRGEWEDRLAAMDGDIAQMEQRLPAAKPSEDPRVAAAIEVAMGKTQRPSGICTHRPPPNFRPKEAVPVAITAAGKLASVRLYYRHVSQAERFQSVEMGGRENTYSANIPGAYTDSPYPLQYYFELREGPAQSWLYPGFAPNLANQPYFVLRRA